MFETIPCVRTRLNVYGLISSITTNILVWRPKHRDGDVDADYRPRTSMACITRYLPVNEFTVLLMCYIYFGHGAVEGENADLLSSHHSAWNRPRQLRPARRIRPGHHCPARRRPLDDHSCCRRHAVFMPRLSLWTLTTVEISSITAVTLQQATPSPRYYRKFHLQNCGIPTVTAVLPPSPLPCRALAPSLFCHRAPDTIVIGTVI